MDEHARLITDTLQLAAILGLALFSLYAGHIMAWGTP